MYKFPKPAEIEIVFNYDDAWTEICYRYFRGWDGFIAQIFRFSRSNRKTLPRGEWGRRNTFEKYCKHARVRFNPTKDTKIIICKSLINTYKLQIVARFLKKILLPDGINGTATTTSSIPILTRRQRSLSRVYNYNNNTWI